MAPAELLKVVRTRPFTPFRIFMSDEAVYEVHHPDMVIVALSTAFVGYPDPAQPGTAARVDMISLRHIVRIEFIPHPAPAGS
jgi:hypothetical protein